MEEDNNDNDLPPQLEPPDASRPLLRDFLMGRLPIKRGTYLAAMLGMFLTKYIMDLLVMASYGEPWSPTNFFAPSYLYLPWDPLVLGKGFGVVLLTLPPFIGASILLALARLKDSGREEALFVLLMLPGINLLFMGVLACIKRSKMPASQSPRPPKRNYVVPVWICIAGSSGFGLIMTILGVGYFEDYGFAIFLAAPFFQGIFAALLRTSDPNADFGKSLTVALLSFLLTGVLILAINIDGIICILMAAPIALLLSTLGVGVFHMLFGKPELRPESTHITMGSLLIWTLVPAGMAGEHYIKPIPPVHAVVSEVVIAAAPQKIWDLVIAFPDLAPPDEPVFRTGIAYPLRASIHGHGIGAIRYCEFSTGPFVEPITTWDEPRRLAFGVTSQPPPMEELSLFYKEVHPPHLDNLTFKSHRGEFQLLPQADGRTLLRGTTWYSNNMFPSVYWKWWSDWIIHKIHLRVLNHIKELAEEG